MDKPIREYDTYSTSGKLMTHTEVYKERRCCGGERIEPPKTPEEVNAILLDGIIQ